MPASLTHTLSAQQLDAALAALAKASETFGLSRIERVLYRSMGLCVAVAVLGLSVGLVVSFMGWSCAAGIIGVIGMLAALAAPILLLLNLGLVFKTFRQRRLLKQLGLQEISISALKADRQRRWLSRFGGAVLTVLGMVLLILMALALVGLLAQEGFGSDEISLLAIFVLSLGTPVLWRFVQRGREQLDIVADADRIRAMLTSMRTGSADGVTVSAAVLEKVAGIEHFQIARERNRAVLAGVSATKRGYGVVIAREVSDQKASLPADLRVDVEELIDELVAAPRQGDGALSARTADGSAEVDYTVDEEHRRIYVVALRTTNAVATQDAHGH